MNKRYKPRWKRLLAKICPRLFWQCPGGGLHWRWTWRGDTRICGCRAGETSGGWHGGIWLDGIELIPLADRPAWHVVMVDLVNRYDRMVAMKIGHREFPESFSPGDVAKAVIAIEDSMQVAKALLRGDRKLADAKCKRCRYESAN